MTSAERAAVKWKASELRTAAEIVEKIVGSTKITDGKYDVLRLVVTVLRDAAAELEADDG